MDDAIRKHEQEIADAIDKLFTIVDYEGAPQIYQQAIKSQLERLTVSSKALAIAELMKDMGLSVDNVNE